jgi:isochorismate hydrolase
MSFEPAINQRETRLKPEEATLIIIDIQNYDQKFQMLFNFRQQVLGQKWERTKRRRRRRRRRRKRKRRRGK